MDSPEAAEGLEVEGSTSSSIRYRCNVRVCHMWGEGKEGGMDVGMLNVKY